MGTAAELFLMSFLSANQHHQSTTELKSFKHIYEVESITSARRYCNQASLFVGSFLCWFICNARCDFMKSTCLIFMKYGTDVQHTVERLRSKVKVQGQNSGTTRTVTTWLWFKTSSPNFTVRQILDYHKHSCHKRFFIFL